MDIESIAVSKIKSLIAQTDTLSAYINEKDTMPSWDGEVLVYKSVSKSKSDILGRVPVQVKGKVDSSKPTNKYYYKYNIDLTDINNYYQDGGVIYFVVKISNDGKTVTPYYQNLLPADLYQIIQSSKKQTTKMIPLIRLPEDVQRLQNIFSDFIEHRDLQRSVKQIGVRSEYDLHQAGYTEHFFRARVGQIKDLVGQSTYLYSKDSMNGIACSGQITFSKFTTYNNNIVISVADKTFFKGASVDFDTEKTQIKFKDCDLILSFQKNNDKIGSINFHPVGRLSKIKLGLEFMLAAGKNAQFCINNQKVFLNYQEIDKQQMITGLTNNLGVISKISDMLLYLGVSADLFVDNMDTVNNLYFVAGSVLDKKIIKINNFINNTGLIRILLNDSGDCLLFRVEHQVGDKDIYTVIDTFVSHPPIKVTTEKNNGEKEENLCSYFVLLHETDFYKVVNFNLDVVHNDIIKYLGFDASREIVNIITIHYWFKLVKAFDATGQNIFLDKATELLEQIKKMDNINQNLAQMIFLNELQITKRKRHLNKEEINKLDKFLTETNQTQNIVGAYLLKGDIANAKVNFEKLDDNIKEIFKAYPIYKFWTE